jgi:transcriptional regulator
MIDIINKLGMGKGDRNKKKFVENDGPSKKEIMSICRNTEDIDEILKYTHSEDDDIRLEACKQLCPCKVLQDIDVFWDRVFEMANDTDVRIRKRVLHIICDGSPERVVDRVYEALGRFNYDPDSDIRRTAHKVMVTYEKTGKWNIL